MSTIPILTSGRLLVDRGLIEPPYEDDGSDWAELYVVETRDPREASLAASYWSSGYRGFLATGDPQRLYAFDGETVAGLPLMTDPSLVEDFYFDFGHVDFAEIYQR